MASLSDIARELNVSVSLVSKVLNKRLGNTGVRPAVVKSIEETAERLGYRKNQNALSLLAKRNNAFAVFLHRHGSEGTNFPQRILEGISGAAFGKHLRMMLQFFDEASGFREKIEDFHTGIVDGIIIAGVAHPELVDLLIEKQEDGLKVVTVYNSAPHRRICNIGLDDHALSYLATERLIRQGCRDIVHFAALKRRTQGFRKAMADHRVSCQSRLFFDFETSGSNGFSSEPAVQAVCGLLDAGVPFDGISAQSDAQAVAVMNELARRGVRIPQDVRIAGIDNSPFCKYTFTPLTSVSQRFRDRGELALNALVDLVDGKRVRSVRIEPRLVVRESA